MTRSRLRPRQPAGQPVVRQGDLGGPGEVLRLVLGQPRQLADGDRGQRHHAGLRRPTSRRRRAPRPGGVAWGALRTSFHSSAGRTGSPSASRVTRPCCWPATETAAHASRVSPRGLVQRRPHARGSTSVPSGWGADRVESGLAGGGVDRHHLAGLGGGVDADDDVRCHAAHAYAVLASASPHRAAGPRAAGPGTPWRTGPSLPSYGLLLQAEARLEPVELGPERGRQGVAELLEPLLDLRDLGRPLLGGRPRAPPGAAPGSGRGRRCRATPGSARGRSGSRPRRPCPRCARWPT